jgi:hypothetical protein
MVGYDELFLSWVIQSRDNIQGVPKLVIQKHVFITSESGVTIWSGTFQKLCLGLKFTFKPPNGIPVFQSCEVTSYLSRTVVAWIGRGGTTA